MGRSIKTLGPAVTIAIVLGIILAIGIPAPVGGAPGPAQVLVTNTASQPVPTTIQNDAVPVIAAERGGLHVFGSVTAAQAGNWIVSAPPRKIFRGSVTYPNGFTNNTNDLLVIDRVSGWAHDSERYFHFSWALSQDVDAVYIPATFIGTTDRHNPGWSMP